MHRFVPPEPLRLVRLRSSSSWRWPSLPCPRVELVQGDQQLVGDLPADVAVSRGVRFQLLLGTYGVFLVVGEERGHRGRDGAGRLSRKCLASGAPNALHLAGIVHELEGKRNRRAKEYWDRESCSCRSPPS